MENTHGPLFIVSREDWSLHRKGHQDQARHQEKVREAIKQNLPDLVSEENIVMSDGKQIIKVPIRSLDEFRFVYNFNKTKHVGQGDGESEVGDVLGVDPSAQKGGKGEGAGDQPGDDIVEAEVSMEVLETLLFEELELPYLKRKEKQTSTRGGRRPRPTRLDDHQRRTGPVGARHRGQCLHQRGPLR